MLLRAGAFGVATFLLFVPFFASGFFWLLFNLQAMPGLLLVRAAGYRYRRQGNRYPAEPIASDMVHNGDDVGGP